MAISGPLYAKRSYGINVKDHGYTLIPLGPTGIRRPGLWSLRRHETQVAAVEDHDRIMHATEPIPIAAALMAFTLMKHGIPGEANLMPKRVSIRPRREDAIGHQGGGRSGSSNRPSGSPTRSRNRAIPSRASAVAICWTNLVRSPASPAATLSRSCHRPALL